MTSSSTTHTVFANDIRELSATVAARQKELETLVASEEAAIEELVKLRARMVTSEGVFDRDDVAMVDEEIGSHREIIQDKKRRLEAEQAKQAAHAKIYDEMSKTLFGRSSILEEENTVLSDHPRLLQRLAQKQLELETMLQERLRCATALR